jgi:hypothetical protein
MAGSHDARSPRGRRSGCLRALLALGAAFALLLLVGCVALLLYLQTPEGERKWAAFQRGVDWAVEAQKAPGTDALREAGCSVALVSTFAELRTALRELVPLNELEGIAGDDAQAPFVLCIGETLSMRGPICPALARAYGAAAPAAPASFLLAVYDDRSGERSCEGVYAPDGSLLRPIKREPQAQSPLATEDTPS